MASASRPAQLSADRPLTDPALDRIGRARFASHIAAAVGLAPPEGMVFGVHGGPGTGKSTVAQFVKAELERGGAMSVVQVNPWLQSSKELHEQLRSHTNGAANGRCTLVVIDDADRLDAAGWQELTRTVMGLATTPDVVQLLVFDRSGRSVDDVARLVQVPFDLPLPEPGALGQMFLDAVTQLLESSPPAPVVTEHHWRQIYSPGIEALLQTPRDVTRFINVLRLSFPPVASEVNAADFIAIEALRVFLPSLYALIRVTPEKFTGANRARTALTADAELQQFHENWILEVDEHLRVDVITLMLRLFPAMPDQPSLIIVRDPPGENVRAELRIATPELFSIYFQLVVPGGVVSNADMDAYMADATDPDRFAALLRRLDDESDGPGTSRLRSVVERLRDVAHEIPRDRAAPMVQGILDAGDELGMVGDRATRDLLWGLLGRLSETERVALLSETIPTALATATGVWIVSELGLEHGHAGGSRDMAEDERMVTLDHLVELEQAGLRAIRSAVAAGRLIRLPGLALVLSCWQRWDRTECVAWVVEASTDDDALIAILVAHMSRARDADGGLGGGYRLDPEDLRPLLSPDVIIHRVRTLAREQRGGEGGAALDQFVLEYDLRAAQNS